MTEELAAPPADEIAPVAPPPALTNAEIEALVKRTAQQLSDERAAGLQRVYDKKFAEQAREIQRLRKAQSADTDDEDDPRMADLEAENRRLEQELELTALRQQYPDLIEDYLALTGKETRAEQLAALSELRQRLTAPPASPDEATVQEPELVIPPVLPNQPARAPQGHAPGTDWSPEQADEYFKRLTVWPGYDR